MDEVKLDVLSSSDLLPILLLLGVGHILALFHDGDVGWQEGLEAILDESERVFPITLALIQVVEENTADTAGFTPMLVVEVLITPLLEARVIVLVVRITGVLKGLVEVDGVLVEEVGGGQIAAAAEPPSLRCAIRVGSFKVSVVEVDRRGHRVIRVKDHAKSSRKEVERLNTGIEGLVVGAHLLNGRLGERAVDDTDADTGLLEDIAFL